MNFAFDSFERFEIPSTSDTLLEQAKGWDPQAWMRLVKTYSPLIYYWCRKSALSPEDSADVTQNVFLTLVRSLPDFRKDDPKHRFRGWLRVVAHSRIVDYFRSAGRKVEAFSLNAESDLDQLLPETDEADFSPGDQSDAPNVFDGMIVKIRQEFEPKTWDAFWRFSVNREPADLVARDLEISPNTVRKYKSRVMRRLRTEFGE